MVVSPCTTFTSPFLLAWPFPTAFCSAKGSEVVAADPGPDEQAELWPTIVAAYKGCDGYQRNTERDIPVVVCTPAEP